MSDVWEFNYIVAFALSDLHFSDKTPRCRIIDGTWIDYQRAYCRSVVNLARKMCAQEKDKLPPLLVAGDVFDNPYPSVELINLVIDFFQNFSTVIAVPGQHDMIMHSGQSENMERTGFGLLEKAKVIKVPRCGVCESITSPYGPIQVAGIGWGDSEELPKCLFKSGELSITLVHKYLWSPYQWGHSVIDTDDSNIDRWLQSFQQLNNAVSDLIISGDNHKRFTIHWQDTTVLNCGNFMIRNADEYLRYARSTIPSPILSPSLSSIKVVTKDQEKLIRVKSHGIPQVEKGCFDLRINDTPEVEVDDTRLRRQLEQSLAEAVGIPEIDFEKILSNLLKGPRVGAAVRGAVKELLREISS